MDKRSYLIFTIFLVFLFSIPNMMWGQRVIDLDKLWGDLRVLGADASDEFGRAVAYGDINGDGYADIIIGAYLADPGVTPRTDAGKTYVIFGSSSPSMTVDLDSQSADITVYGRDADDSSGYVVASGDVNGDGYDDILIGAPYADPGGRLSAGETYVIFGSSSPPPTIDLSTQSADITVSGDDKLDNCGQAVASGDVNGDGYEDIIIGAYNASPPGRKHGGETYVVFGSSPSSPVTIDLSSESADITVYGEETNDYSGYAVGSGDVNGDSYDDLIIGAYRADPAGGADAGEAYVFFGSNFPSPPYSIDLNYQSADITVYGADMEYWCGSALDSGDINGDGYDDLIIAAYGADPAGRVDAGETYVLFGFSSTWPGNFIIDLSIESANMTVFGDVTNSYSGYAVASGDVDGDEYDDLIIGAYGAAPGGRINAGETYVIFGSSNPSSTIDLSTQSAGINFCGDDDADESGCAVASGDVNGDGYADIIIGAHYADTTGGIDAGEANLILGGGAFITAHGIGGKSWIKEFNLLTNSLNTFKAFGAVNSQGEVHLAVGDVDADSLDEIAAGQGEGAKSWVKFFEVNGSLISTFKAYGAANTKGELHMAIGNFDADTSDNEIAIGQGEGGQSWVKTFKADGTFVASFKAFGAANAQGEVHLAAGDLENADGVDEIIAGMGESGSSRVKIFNYEGTVIRSFKAYDVANNPGGEVHLTVGNFDADADLEIAAATGYNGGNKVRLFKKDGTVIRGFTAFGFGGNPNGDVQIAVADIDNDGIDELICAHGEGGGSWVKLFKADGTFIRTFKAFGAGNAQGEVHLGKSNY